MAIEPSVNHPINCGLATTVEFSRQFAKQTIADRTADLQLFLEYAPLSSGSSSPVTIGDTNYIRNTYPTSATNFRAFINYLPEKFASVDSIESRDETILANTISNPLFFEYKSTGTTSIVLTFNTNEKIAKSVNTSTLSESSTKDIFQNFISGSLGLHIYEQIREYANGSTSAPTHYPLYSTFNQNANIYAKNINNWTANLDFSGLTVNKSGSGGITNVTAITPYHAIGAAHYSPQIGDILYFCDSNNQTVSRTVQNISMFFPDTTIVRFTEPLPSSVKKYKTLPSNFRNYLPINENSFNSIGQSFSYRGTKIPIIVCSHYRWDPAWTQQRQNRYAYFYQTIKIRDAELAPEYASVSFYSASYEPNNFPEYNGDPSRIRGGDSGSPSFFVINNDLVLVSCHTTGTSGSFHPSYLGDIQTAINTLGPSGYSYETIDLSSFTSFSS